MSSIKKISLKDIAETAGVSTALVSFVLNGKKKKYRVGDIFLGGNTLAKNTRRTRNRLHSEQFE